MSEAIKNQPVYYTKEFSDSYHNREDNFVASQELTVTITLNEYRELISRKAISENSIDKANSDRWEKQRENEKLKAENDELKSKLYEISQKSVKSEPDCDDSDSDEN